jgi:hypothetical protein
MANSKAYRVAALVALALPGISATAMDADALHKEIQLVKALFECGNLAPDDSSRLAFVTAAMPHGRSLLTALDADEQLRHSVDDFVFETPGPSVDFRLGTAYETLGNRLYLRAVGDRQDAERWGVEKWSMYRERNCELLLRKNP